MSTPINHHHVSQCHSRLFFNEQDKKIYYYNKELDKFDFKLTTKSIFSEDYANTKLENDEFDHKSLEDELNKYFEKDFDRHARNIIELAENPTENDESKLESLYYIACYALIADVRFPDNKKNIDNSYDSLMLENARKLRLLGDEEQALAVEKSIADSKRTKYSNVVNYTKIAASRLSKMGDLDFNIYRINTTEAFLLPDIGCVQIRERINNYINRHIQEVAIIGIPLTDKVFVFACSKKLGDTSSGVTTINDLNSAIVKDINRQLFESALKIVATKDESQLKKIVSEQKGSVQQ
jgi:Protein of unknown function (DUF4238)